MSYNILKAVEFDKCSAKFKKKYGNVQALLDAGWWLQPKYDGCFGWAVIRAEDRKMLSREGKDYSLSCKHILDYLWDQVRGYYDDEFECAILGEVWHPDREFPVISGQFRKRAPSDLVFMMNDLVPLDMQSVRHYSARFDQLNSIFTLDHEAPANIAALDTDYSNDVVGYANMMKAKGGYDGAILRCPWAGYAPGLASEGQIVKVKPLLSLDLVVTAWNSAPGEKTGRPVYTIEVSYNGVITTVGSGVPHDFKDVPQPGQIVDIDCMGITADGKLREPRFKGIKFDKEQPDG